VGSEVCLRIPDGFDRNEWSNPSGIRTVGQAGGTVLQELLLQSLDVAFAEPQNLSCLADEELTFHDPLQDNRTIPFSLRQCHHHLVHG